MDDARALSFQKLTAALSAPQPATQSPVDEQLRRRWTFEKGAPEDIEIRDGEWRWDGKDQMAAASTGVMLLLPEPIPHKPMMLQIKISSIQQRYGWSCYWSDGDRNLSRRLWPKHLKQTNASGKTITMYLIGSFVIDCFDGEPSGIAEYNTAYPASRIAVSLQGVCVNEIELRTVEERELPLLLSDPKSLIAKRDQHAVEAGEELFPPRLKP